MKLTVLGCGSWATALAKVFADAGFEVTLTGRKEDTSINEKHINERYFPDVVLNPLITYSTQVEEEVKNADMVMFALPSLLYRQTARRISPYLKEGTSIISTAKGFDPTTQERLSQVLRQELAMDKVKPIVSLIGPSFATEVIHSKITALAAVSQDLAQAQYIQHLISSDCFRVYSNNDEISSECASALKNVIAIAGGVLAGLKEGDNAKAALITRGLQEMIRFGVSLGGRKETFFGLTGIGDLLLTCSSMQSRNYSLGYAIGQADDADIILQANTKTVEGVNTSKYAILMAEKMGIDMPITKGVYQCLFEHQKPSMIIHKTMSRALKDEQ